jgi:hypothetical protein
MGWQKSAALSLRVVKQPKNRTMKILLQIACLLFSTGVFAQVYISDWNAIGYVPGSGGGIYTNVGGSNIDITVTGLSNDWLFGSRMYAHQSYPILQTGINNNGQQGIQHTYTYTFSEPVTCRLRINNINVGWNSWYDKLVFSGNPTFLTNRDVLVIDSINTILPTGDENTAYVDVRYENVTTFTITHGLGGINAINPGYIELYPLLFSRSVISSVGEVEWSECISVYPNPANHQITISKGNLELSTVKIVSVHGTEVGAYQFELGEDKLNINTLDFENGIYFIQIIDKERRYMYKKVHIQH